MKTKLLFVVAVGMATITTMSVKAQDIKTSEVPAVVKSALAEKYPEASKAKVGWEKEKGNYEANWGGKSGEDNSVQFTPSGTFVEIVKAISVSGLPANIAPYVKAHYKGAKISEAGLLTDASGTTMYEVEVKGSDLIFSKSGEFIKKG